VIGGCGLIVFVIVKTLLVMSDDDGDFWWLIVIYDNFMTVNSVDFRKSQGNVYRACKASVMEGKAKQSIITSRT